MTHGEEAVAALRRLTHDANAQFRSGQLEAIEAVLGGVRRSLVVQRTGWGKSAVYFIATQLNRSAGRGPTVIVSPLLALMRNQIEAARALDLHAETVNSTNTDDWTEIFARIDANEIDVLLISPERLNNQSFKQTVLPGLLNRLGLLVIDEAHCISDWGHDFRPDYRLLEQIVADLPPSTPVLCTTATANDRVVADIESQLGSNITVIRGTLDRPGLQLQVIDMPSKAHRLAWLADTIPNLDGAGIVYTLTVADARRTGDFLRSKGIDAESYMGSTDTDERLEIERRLLNDELKVVVATSALAMGYDNPFVRFVIHFQVPGSAVFYYQQVGRAGRAVDRSYGIALAGSEDRNIQNYFIENAIPTKEKVDEVLHVLADGGGLSTPQVLSQVNITYGRLGGLLKLLEVEGAATKEGSKWYRSARRWDYPTERFEAVTAQRRTEQAAMAHYVQSDECLMMQLRQLLDDPADPCGICANCLGHPLLPTEPSAASVSDANAFLGREVIHIAPKKHRPAGQTTLGLPSCEPGFAVTRYNEGHLGSLVKAGKYTTGSFSDELIEAGRRLVERWFPTKSIDWVTAVPDSEPGGIVESYTRRLAESLRLPYVQTIRRTGEGEPQKAMENSYMQATNALSKFRATQQRSGTVLLVDDIIDSKWTMTAVAHLLRANDAEAVHPLGLAYAGHDS